MSDLVGDHEIDLGFQRNRLRGAATTPENRDIIVGKLENAGIEIGLFQINTDLRWVPNMHRRAM